MNYITLIALFILPISVLGQTLRIANNNANAPVGTHMYASAQEAIDAAVDGDIIQIAPSATSYGTITVSKSISIQGIGYNPDKDSPFVSTLDVIEINSIQASGASISGIIANDILLATDDGNSYTLSNVIIESCLLNRILQTKSNVVDNLIIRNCILNDGGTSIALTIDLASDTNIQNSEISNNIIQGFSGGFGGVGAVSAGNFTLIKNNLFLGPNNPNYSFAFDQLMNCIITNNIFNGRSPRFGFNGASEGNIFSNNLSFGSNPNLPPAATGTNQNTGVANQVNVDPTITGLAVNSLWVIGMDFILEAGSPVINAGTDGTDLGPMGGAFPFTQISTGSNIPVIQEVNTSGLVNEGENLSVDIQATSN